MYVYVYCEMKTNKLNVNLNRKAALLDCFLGTSKYIYFPKYCSYVVVGWLVRSCHGWQLAPHKYDAMDDDLQQEHNNHGQGVL